MKKKILYIGNVLSHKGGTSTTIENLGRLLSEEGHIVHIASSKKNKLLRLLDMICTTLQLQNVTDIVLIDTYSTSNFWYAVVIGRLSEFFKTPYIPILHGGDLPKRIQNTPKTSRRLFTRAKVNVAPSNYLMEAFRKEGYSNLKTIANTIVLKNYPLKNREILSPKLLWVRSFSKIYNPLMAIKVLEKLQEQFPKATLTMVGPEKDESYQECLAFAKAKHLPVTFTGKLSKEAWINLAVSHDIFINTTNFDNMPVSVIEAMALGLPVVSTNVGGLPFLIDHNKNGVLCPAQKIDPFVNSIKRLLSEPEFVSILTKNARIKAESFDWKAVKSQWEEALS